MFFKRSSVISRCSSVPLLSKVDDEIPPMEAVADSKKEGMPEAALVGVAREFAVGILVHVLDFPVLLDRRLGLEIVLLRSELVLFDFEFRHLVHE